GRFAPNRRRGGVDAILRRAAIGFPGFRRPRGTAKAATPTAADFIEGDRGSSRPARDHGLEWRGGTCCQRARAAGSGARRRQLRLATWNLNQSSPRGMARYAPLSEYALSS